MTEVKKTVATTLSAYYRLKEEKMPIELKYLIFNYNIHSIDYEEFKTKIFAGPNDQESGDIDGNEEDKDEVIKFQAMGPNEGDIDGGEKNTEEVIRFILDPENSYLLGKIGHSKLVPTNLPERFIIQGRVIDEGNMRLLLK